MPSPISKITFLAGLLINKQLYDQAKTEIIKILEVRDLHQWRIPAEVLNWKSSNWFDTAIQSPDNNKFYQKHRSLAESLIFSDLPEVLIAVEYVNKDKKMVNFVQNTQISGFFKYEGFFDKLNVGDLLFVRFSSKGDNFYQLYTAQKAPENTPCDAVKLFGEKVSIRPGNSFGFAGDVFIDANLFTKHNLIDQQPVSGKTILSFNKKKNQWGWKAIQIND